MLYKSLYVKCFGCVSKPHPPKGMGSSVTIVHRDISGVAKETGSQGASEEIIQRRDAHMENEAKEVFRRGSCGAMFQARE